MKRGNDYFSERSLYKEEGTELAHLVCFFIAIFSVILFLLYADTTPATEDDYFALEHNLNALVNSETIAKIDNPFVVIFENEECSIKGTYEPKSHSFSINRNDKAYETLPLIWDCLLLVGLVYIFSFMIVSPIVTALISIIGKSKS